MGDSRLTDLPSKDSLANNDVLYVVDVNGDSSNKITYGDLINTKFDQLSSNFFEKTSGGDFTDIPVLTAQVTSLSSDVNDLLTDNVVLCCNFPAISINTNSFFTSSFLTHNSILIGENGEALKQHDADKARTPLYDASNTFQMNVSTAPGSIGGYAGLSGLMTSISFVSAEAGFFTSSGLASAAMINLSLFNPTGLTVKIPQNRSIVISKYGA